MDKFSIFTSAKAKSRYSLFKACASIGIVSATLILQACEDQKQANQNIPTSESEPVNQTEIERPAPTQAVLKVQMPFEYQSAAEHELPNEFGVTGFNDQGVLWSILSITDGLLPNLSPNGATFQLTDAESSNIFDITELFSYDIETNSFIAQTEALIEKIQQEAPNSKLFSITAVLVQQETWASSTHYFKFEISGIN